MSLSSMNLDNNLMWDSERAIIGNETFSFPQEDGWINSEPVWSDFFGLEGGSSSWKEDAPTIEIMLDRPLQVTGWKTKSNDPNDDNIGFWAASDHHISSWNYRIIAKNKG